MPTAAVLIAVVAWGVYYASGSEARRLEAEVATTCSRMQHEHERSFQSAIQAGRRVGYDSRLFESRRDCQALALKLPFGNERGKACRAMLEAYGNSIRPLTDDPTSYAARAEARSFREEARKRAGDCVG